MIDKNLPEPAIEHRYCVFCGKTKRLTGRLIHFPDEACEKAEMRLMGGQMCQTFSMWTYKCAWCKGIDTKRRLRDRVESDIEL